MCCRPAQSVEYLHDARTILHRDNPQLVLLVDPDEESLVDIVENAAAARPVTIEVASLKESITLLEQEVVRDQLPLGGRAHSLKWIERAGEVTLECLSGCYNFLHDL